MGKQKNVSSFNVVSRPLIDEPPILSLPGPPLTEQGAVSLLLAHNVTVAVGVTGGHEARNQRFDLGWVRSAYRQT